MKDELSLTLLFPKYKKLYQEQHCVTVIIIRCYPKLVFFLKSLNEVQNLGQAKVGPF